MFAPYLDLRAAQRDHGFRPCDTEELAAQTIGVADKGGDETVAWPAIDFLRRAELADAPLRHHRQPVGKAQGLALVVGDEDRRDAELALDFAQLDLHRGAQILVERGKRLIEQQHGRIDDQRARQRDALLLAAGELARLAVLQCR